MEDKMCLMCSKLLVNTKKFCCKKCYSEYQSKFMLGKKCNAYGHTTIFSQETKNKLREIWNKKHEEKLIHKKCELCNKSFEVLPSHSKKRFCSINCVGNWKSGKSYEEIVGDVKAKEMKIKQSNIRKGCSVWNKGLTKYNNEIIRKISLNAKENAKNNPIFARGKHHSEETREKLRLKRMNRVYPLKDTSIEVKIQDYLKKLGIEYTTHFYVKGMKHGYQCDIFIPSMNLIIECDGDYWHGNPIFFPEEKLNERQKKQRSDDIIRNTELHEKGFKVIRLWENEIRNLDLNDFGNIVYAKI